MASYINLTLDTIGPAGVSVIINNGETKTNLTSATLAIACSDADLTGYQMKIWGTSSAVTEEAASWETFQTIKNITLPTGDGAKTIYVKVRDDVWNESATVSDTISLYTKVPAVINIETSHAKISTVSGKDRTYGGFEFDEAIDAMKMMIVQDINAAHDAATNISIPRTNGSYLLDEKNADAYPGDKLEYDAGNIDGNVRVIEFDISGADIAAASPGDGVKIIKVFVRSAASGNWSV